MKNNQKGEITLVILVAVAVASLLLGTVAPKINPLKGLFGGGEVSAVGKKASFTTQTEKVKSKVYKMKDGEVIVVPEVELSYNTGIDQNLPRPTFGEQIGNWFFHATTATIIFILVSIFCFGGAPLFWLWKRGNSFKDTLKRQVEGTKNLKAKNPDAYNALTNELAISHDKKNKIVIDQIKTELNK